MFADGAISVFPKFVFLTIPVFVTRYLLKVVRLFFDAVATGSVTLGSFAPEWAAPTYKLVRILIIAFAVVVAYPHVPGAQTEAFKGLSLFVGVVFSLGSSSYETPWRQVEAMLLEAASRTDGLQKEPTPFVLQRALGDFAVTYEINVYCSTPALMPRLYAALHRNILDTFNEYGVQIMTPAYEGDPEQPKVVPREASYQAPAKPE